MLLTFRHGPAFRRKQCEPCCRQNRQHGSLQLGPGVATNRSLATPGFRGWRFRGWRFSGWRLAANAGWICQEEVTRTPCRIVGVRHRGRRRSIGGTGLLPHVRLRPAMVLAVEVAEEAALVASGAVAAVGQNFGARPHVRAARSATAKAASAQQRSHSDQAAAARSVGTSGGTRPTAAGTRQAGDHQESRQLYTHRSFPPLSRRIPLEPATTPCFFLIRSRNRVSSALLRKAQSRSAVVIDRRPIPEN